MRRANLFKLFDSCIHIAHALHRSILCDPLPASIIRASLSPAYSRLGARLFPSPLKLLSPKDICRPVEFLPSTFSHRCGRGVLYLSPPPPATASAISSNPAADYPLLPAFAKNSTLSSSAFFLLSVVRFADLLAALTLTASASGNRFATCSGFITRHRTSHLLQDQ